MKFNNDGPERRMILLAAELRAATEEGKESRTVRCEVAVFNQETVIGKWYREKIDPGFFDPILENPDSDVVALFNHDSNLVLARRSSGTLKLFKEGEKLIAEFEAPENTAGNDLLVSLKRGDIKGCSFSFMVEAEEWVIEEHNEYDLRILKKCAELFDVGPVTFPAYPQTDVFHRNRPDRNEKFNWRAKARERDLALKSKLVSQ